MVRLIAASAGAVAAFVFSVTPAGVGVESPAKPAVPVAPGQATEGGDGLRAQASTSFVVDAEARVIRGSTEMTLTHEYDPDYYFHAYDIPVLLEATNHRAVRSDGAALPVAVERDANPDAAFAHAVVDLQPNLFAGDTITFRLDYDIPFQAPRSEGWSRGNDAVITFPAISPGDPGLSRLEVRLPVGYEVEVGGAELARFEEGGQLVLRAEAIDEPWTFMPVVAATREDHLLSHDAEVAGLTLHLQAWPDDPAWVDFIAEQLDAQMPVLEELVGQEWPADRGELEVIESSVPTAHGYAGWFDHAENSITLGDDFDPATVAHELAHVWFNATLFTGRWINEGMADEIAESALAELGTPGFRPATLPPPDPAGPGAVALNDWAELRGFEEVDHDRELYAYHASWYVIDQIADELGVEGLRSVVTAAVERAMTYPGDPGGEELTGQITWRILLDLLENAGSTRADDLFARYVANPAQRAEMEARRAARAAYVAFVPAGGEWTPPFQLRQALGVWDFHEVGDHIAAAQEILAVRDEILEVLEGLDVELRGLEDDYETATNLEVVAEDAATTLEAAEAYRDVVAEHDEVTGDLVARIGLLASGADARLDDARDALEGGRPAESLKASEGVEERLDTAVRNGLLRLGAAGLLVLLGVTAALWGPVHRRRARVRERARREEIDRLEALFQAPPAEGAEGAEGAAGAEAARSPASPSDPTAAS